MGRSQKGSALHRLSVKLLLKILVFLLSAWINLTKFINHLREDVKGFIQIICIFLRRKLSGDSQ